MLKIKYLISIAVPLTVLLGSCGRSPELAAVRELATLADQAQEKLPKVANDIHDSCLRAARYKAPAVIPLAPAISTIETSRSQDKNEVVEAINDLINRTSSSLPTTQQLNDLKNKLNSLPPSSNRLQQRADEQQKCQILKENFPLGKNIKNGNAIIVLYLQKLVSVASENISFDNEFNNFSASSKNLAGELTPLFGLAEKDTNVVQSQVEAGTGLANFILTSIFRQKRLDTLKTIIPETDKALTTYSKGLEIVVQRVYIDQYLKTEERSLDGYYEDIINDLLKSNQQLEGLSVIALADVLVKLDQEKWNPEKDRIEERRKLAEDYIDVLETVVASHNKLATIYGKGKDPSKEVVKELLDKNRKALKNFVNQANSLQEKSNPLLK
ncbi:MAG: hypothetical protein RM368_33425 [Nostoc sp. DedSLP03]|uniref:hypothetical protein n=1 Tax=Nostoc sp. DedSLP03 TaxID=3075400 RepID=UPI002AD54949|nr:hypothetical protein [Nostoc sp. DedSLP03]MDZ7969792.1 hypothetical protein [Nostoc sp. DedSLP03]